MKVTPMIRDRVIRSLTINNLSLRQTAVRFNLSPNTIFKIKKEYDENNNKGIKQ